MPGSETNTGTAIPNAEATPDAEVAATPDSGGATEHESASPPEPEASEPVAVPKKGGDEKSKKKTLDEAEDEVLNRIFSGEGESDEEANAEPAPPNADTSPKLSAEDRERALRVLRRDNVPDKMIDRLLEGDPAELNEWLDKAETRQSNIDKKMRGSQTEEAKDTDDEDNADPTGSPANNTLAELVRPLADELVSDHAETVLTGLAEYIQRETLSKFEPVLEAITKQVKALESLADQQLRSRERSSLKERFPQVGEDEKWELVNKKAEELAETGKYKDYTSCFADAARIVLADDAIKDAQQKNSKRNSARRNGTPTTPSRTHTGGPTSAEEVEDLVLSAIFDGKDPRAVLAQR